MDVAKYLHPMFACFVCGGGVHLKRNNCAYREALLTVEVCLLPIHDYYSAETALVRLLGGP